MASRASSTFPTQAPICAVKLLTGPLTILAQGLRGEIDSHFDGRAFAPNQLTCRKARIMRPITLIPAGQREFLIERHRHADHREMVDTLFPADRPAPGFGYVGGVKLARVDLLLESVEPGLG